MNKKLFEIKSDCKIEDIQEMQIALFVLYTATVLFCNENNLPCKITSMASDRAGVRAKSRTHEEFRAFDISVTGWTQVDIHRFVFILNNNYRELGAISASDLNSRCAIYHNYKGQGDHIHIQVRHNAKINKFVKWGI